MAWLIFQIDYNTELQFHLHQYHTIPGLSKELLPSQPAYILAAVEHGGRASVPADAESKAPKVGAHDTKTGARHSKKKNAPL